MRPASIREDEPYVIIKMEGQPNHFTAYVNYDAKKITGFLPVRLPRSDSTKYINKNLIEHITVQEREQKYIYDFFGEIK